MLILTRRVGETVMIGNDVTVTVLGVKGNQVRVGVNAPKDVAVHREEIYERIKREEDQDGPRAGNDHQDRRRRLKNIPKSQRYVSLLYLDCSTRVSSGAPWVMGRPVSGEVAEWSKARPC